MNPNQPLFKVFVTRRIPEVGLKRIEPYAQIEVWEDELPPPKDILLEKVRGIDGLLCLLTDPIDAAVMDAAGPSLKVISQYAVGYDNIDISSATRRGIPVGNTPGVLTDATADLAWALLMAAARRIVEADRYTRAGKWKTWGPQTLLGASVAGATIGIVGFGRIGQAMAKRARGFDMRILYHDLRPNPQAAAETGAQFTSLDLLLAKSDFVTIHTWLSEESHHLFNDETLRKMKPTAILINTARGQIVDPDALYRALKNGVIAYAALDVTEPEPIPMDSPLLQLENLIIVPHIGSASVASRSRMAEMAAENLIAGLKGEELPNCINPQVYSRPKARP